MKLHTTKFDLAFDALEFANGNVSEAKRIVAAHGDRISARTWHKAITARIQHLILEEERMDAPIQPTTYAYDDAAKDRQSRRTRRFYREAQKSLPGFTFNVRFNRGGIAVWGETYAKIFRDNVPVVEAYDTGMGVLVRQWDGRNSGANHYAKTLQQFVNLVNLLASKPFVRF